MSKKGEFTIDLVFDRRSRLYRLAESGTASSKVEEGVLGKRKAPLKGTITIEETEEAPQLKENNSVYEEDDEMDNENDFQQEDERARQEELLTDYSSRTFILPSCSKWFSLSDIHELEM